MYRIIGADQREYGPVDVDELRRWIAAGSVNSQTLVKSGEYPEWKPLAAFPELALAMAETRAATLAPPVPTNLSVLPPDILQRDYQLDIGSCLTRSWQLLTNNSSTLLAGTALYLAIQVGIVCLSQIPFLGAIAGMAGLFVAGPLLAGTSLFVLRHIRHERIASTEILAGFGPRFLHLMLIHLFETLVNFVLMIPGVLVAGIGLIPLLLGSREPGWFLIPMIALGALLTTALATCASSLWVFALPLAIEKRLDFWQAMETSRKVVIKHWWRVLLLVMICGCIGFASVLLCVVPVFFGTPFVLGALMFAYEDLFAHRPATAEAVERLPMPPA